MTHIKKKHADGIKPKNVNCYQQQKVYEQKITKKRDKIKLYWTFLHMPPRENKLLTAYNPKDRKSVV